MIFLPSSSSSSLSSCEWLLKDSLLASTIVSLPWQPHGDPGRPFGPASPLTPLSPAGPGGPGSPFGPFGPGPLPGHPKIK